MPIFDFLAANPETASMFSETMIGFHGAEPPAVADAYDFSGVTTLMDIGGASGHLLATILGRHPARAAFSSISRMSFEMRPRCSRRGCGGPRHDSGGKLFRQRTRGGDAYLLSHIIHDWSEEQCLTILGNCRRAMVRRAVCSSSRWCFPRAIRRTRARCSIS